MELLKKFKKVGRAYNDTSLVIRIIVGMLCGVVFYMALPKVTGISILGDLFVGALKAIAPILVFVLVSSALAAGSSKLDKRFGLVILFYLLSTFLAAVSAVVLSFAFPQKLALKAAAKSTSAPGGIGEVIKNVLLDAVQNPLNAIIEGKYIGILFWAVLFGFAIKNIGSDTTKRFMKDVSDGISQIVKWIINFAPFGIAGLVYTNLVDNGLKVFFKYGKLLALLIGCMLVVAFVVDPLIAGIALKRNPYPLVIKCLKESGITAFFTRSSAANIPVNMELCERMGLDKNMYSVSIPLGATINMDGAAITITVMTLAAANTVGVNVSIGTAVLLSVLSALAACGASGVAGGSLLLIPMACSLFGISDTVAMQVVSVGFMIGVVQDSIETMLNSAGDAMFAATAEFCQWQKEGKRLPDFMYSRKEKADFANQMSENLE